MLDESYMKCDCSLVALGGERESGEGAGGEWISSGN